MQVILDLHSYGRYQLPSNEGQIIGSEPVPMAAFADFWSKMAQAVRDEPSLYAYGLMNEPHDMGDPERWPRAAQAAVDAIRRVDMRTAIIVSGDDWSSARRWHTGTNDELHLKVLDPHNNLIFEAHCYFDKDGSGTYRGSYEVESASPDTGVEYVRPFVEWCRKNRVRGFIGEYGVPDTDTRWLITMDRFLAYLNANNISSAYWSAGPWWGRYALSIEPEGLDPKAPQAAVDRPQMIVLRQYPG
jgi:endoglucanase